MANENKEKKGIVGRVMGGIRWVKILKNPITWYILVGIFILLLLAGVIAFITALPGAISGKFTEMITALFKADDNPAIYNVTDDEIKDMAEYLESMGYDIENYGFVEEIERESAIKGDHYQDNKPSRGTIISVKSKYLEAYIGEEKKMYKIAPENYNRADITEDYYLIQAINQFVSNDENLQLYYYYQLKGTDLSTLSIETQEKFTEGKQRATVEIATKIEEAYHASITEGSKRTIGAGMIVLVGRAKNENFKSFKWIRKVFGRETNYEFSIDVENRRLKLSITYIPENEDGWTTFVNTLEALVGLDRAHLYTVDLEQYLSKYGKPSEFTLALHLATQAPDFVYKLATSSSTDTKVYLDMWIRQEDYIPVTAVGGIMTLMDHIAEQDANPDVHKNYIDWLEKIKDRLAKNWADQYARKITTQLEFPGSTGDDWFKLGLDEIEKIIRELNHGYGSVEEVINEIIGKLGQYGISRDEIEEQPFIPIQGVLCSYRDMIELKDNVIPSLEKTVNVATPYVTQVVQHWYRNQYFTMEGNELEKAKEIATSFLDNLKVRIEARLENTNIEVDADKESINKIKENGSKEKISIDGVDYKVTKDVKDVIEALQKKANKLINYFTDETIKESMRQYLETKIKSIAKNYGTTYKEVPVADKWTSLEGFSTSGRPNVNQVISNSYWRIKSTNDIQQIHNPQFEDNSQFIRNWLKEKYVIYDGVSRTEEERVLGAKSYIQGKTALENLVAMLDKATTSEQYLKYMKRDVVEFMQDYAFDLDQIQDTVAEKNLENIMPDYVPYTPWPSEYEKADSIWTKMIYKTDATTNLVAPADCIITTKGEIIEIGILDETGLVNEYVYLCSDEDANGNQLTDLEMTDGEYKKGEIIGTAAPSSDSEIEGTNLSGQKTKTKVISIKLQMLSHTKQRIDITTRMNVRNKELSEVEAEKSYIYIIMSAAKVYDTKEFTLPFYGLDIGILSYDPDMQLYAQECLALLNTAFNRISSPYCSDKDLSTTNYWEMGIAKNIGLKERKLSDGTSVWEFTGKPDSNPQQEFKKKNINIDSLINLALRGSDRTKEGTILGATTYAKIWVQKTIKANQENTKTIYTELPNVTLKMAIGGGGFYITNEEYKLYQTYYVNDKVRSIFIQLNEQKDELNKQKGYSAGYGKYQISRTEEAGEELKKYFEYVEDTIYGIAENSCVTSVIVTGINEEINEEEEKQFIDTFRIKVNSNVAVDVTIKYNCTEEGKILYDTMEYTTEEVERL